MGLRAYVIRLSQISSFFSYCHDKYATLADVVKHCVENLTNHVLRYRKLLMDDKSGNEISDISQTGPTMALYRLY